MTTIIPSHLPEPSGDVIVWTKPACVQCTAVKRRLTEANVPFVERDLTHPDNASDLEYFQKLGYRSAPITEHGTTAVPGYAPAEIDRIIAAWREQHPTPVDLRVQAQEYTDTTAAYHAGEDVIPGDCWRACLASLLEVPIAEVPHFAYLYPAEGTFEWWEASVAWVRDRLPGWTLGCWRRPEDGGWPAPGVYSAEDASSAPDRVILTAPSPRGPWNHSVLVYAATGELAHDPFPGGTGVGDGPGDIVGLVRQEWQS